MEKAQQIGENQGNSAQEYQTQCAVGKEGRYANQSAANLVARLCRVGQQRRQIDKKCRNTAALVFDVKDEATDFKDTEIVLVGGIIDRHRHAKEIDQRSSSPGNRPEIKAAEPFLPIDEDPHQYHQAQTEKQAESDPDIHSAELAGSVFGSIVRVPFLSFWLFFRHIPYIGPMANLATLRFETKSD